MCLCMHVCKCVSLRTRACAYMSVLVSEYDSVWVCVGVCMCVLDVCMCLRALVPVCECLCVFPKEGKIGFYW